MFVGQQVSVPFNAVSAVVFIFRKKEENDKWIKCSDCRHAIKLYSTRAFPVAPCVTSPSVCATFVIIPFINLIHNQNNNIFPVSFCSPSIMVSLTGDHLLNAKFNSLSSVFTEHTHTLRSLPFCVKFRFRVSDVVHNLIYLFIRVYFAYIKIIIIRSRSPCDDIRET